MLLKNVKISGYDVLPIIEGGKGVAVSSGVTAGNFALNGAVGTFSGVNADSYDENGNVIPQVYDSKLTRREKFEKLTQYAIDGALAQADIAYEIADKKGPVHMNVLWEAGGTEHILEEVLKNAKGKIAGVTSGAGLPYKLAEICARYNTYYYPIISSARALAILWKRAYSKTADLLGGVVYEDPWLAGGHNGLSSAEDPKQKQDPFLRVSAIRTFLNSVGLEHVPIIIAGGVWKLKEWESYIDNKEIGTVAFQFGTRPLVTQESPIPDTWKQLLLNLKEGDISLNKFSPTGFYSSAARNKFLINLEERSARQVEVSREKDETFTEEFSIRPDAKRFVYIKQQDAENAKSWLEQGYNYLMRTPDNTVVFVTKEESEVIKQDQAGWMGCLSHCMFSGWKDKEPYSTGKSPDPRSFCIQKSLQNIAHVGDVENNLAFSGHYGYRFATDELYKDGYIPTIKELIEKIKIGQ